MAARVSLVLVDFDDTLVDTAPRFQNARRSPFSVLSSIGVADELAQAIHHERVDPVILERHGLGPEPIADTFLRVPSFVEAVNYLLRLDS